MRNRILIELRTCFVFVILCVLGLAWRLDDSGMLWGGLSGILLFYIIVEGIIHQEIRE